MKTQEKAKAKYTGVGSSFDDHLKKKGSYDKVMARAQAEVDSAKEAYDNSRWVRMKYTLAQWWSAVFNLVYLIPSRNKSKRAH